MTDLRQAAQQALEALEGWEHCDKWVWPVSALEQSKRNTTESLAALRAALEQQDEPTCPDCKAAVLYECVACSSNNYPPKQQQAEPDRRRLQAEGKHPAPCARHCEAKAFEIEIRSLKSALETQAASKEDMKVYRSIVDNYWKGLAAKAEQQAEPVAYDKTAMNCQCEACKNGNIHDSDCSVHNGDALPVGPCDCSLATPPQQQAESSAERTLRQLGYTDCGGEVWKPPLGKAAQPEQQAEPVAWTTMPEAEDWCFVSGSKDPTGKLEGKWFPLYTTPPQRPWVGLTVTTILDMMPSTIPAEYDGPLMQFARDLEAKLKERNGY